MSKLLTLEDKTKLNKRGEVEVDIKWNEINHCIMAGRGESLHGNKDGQSVVGLVVPSTYSSSKFKTFGDRVFAYAGPSMWNKLPKHIQMMLDLRQLKTCSLKNRMTFNCVPPVTAHDKPWPFFCS